MSKNIKDHNIERFEKTLGDVKAEMSNVKESLLNAQEKNLSFMSILKDIKQEMNKINAVAVNS